MKDVPFIWDIAFVEIFEGEKKGTKSKGVSLDMILQVLEKTKIKGEPPVEVSSDRLAANFRKVMK